MRITVLDDDSGQKIDPSRERYRVLLDGEEVKHCFTADDEEGEVIEALTDESGWMAVKNGEVKRRAKHGKVYDRKPSIF